MAKVEKIEYYGVCPSCGATNGERAVCAYCGTSLIKNREIRDVKEVTLEDKYHQEDVYLPIIEGSLVTSDPAYFVFALLFGGIFLLVPTFLCIIFTVVGLMMPLMILFFGLFWVIGIGAFVPVIRSATWKKKLQNGRVIQGIVRGYEDGSILVNNRPVQSIRILVEDAGIRKILILSTGDSKKRYGIGQRITLRNVEKKYLIET